MIKAMKEQKIGYQFYCFLVLFFTAVYRTMKKSVNGKCGKLMQTIYSILAFGCLGGIVYVCASLENDLISIFHAALTAGVLLAGFSLFCSLAGAFRSHRYIKRKQQFTTRKKMISIQKSADRVQKSA